jgi:RsiW-degrading membrane proteinase PrsW (M82 family)
MIIYLTIGLALAILLDWFIWKTESSERLTFSEIVGCVIFWPFILLKVIIEIFKQQ